MMARYHHKSREDLEKSQRGNADGGGEVINHILVINNF